MSVKIKANNSGVLRKLSKIFISNHELILSMTKREIRDRYAGNFLGLFWSIGYPLIQIGFYLIVFGSIFKLRYSNQSIAGPLYMLTGITPWIIFSEILSKSCFVILANSGLVKQIVFPIDILPVKSALASMFTELIFIIVLLIYMVIASINIPLTIFALPIFLFFQGILMIGIAYVLSSITVFFKDTKEFVGIAIMFGVFTLPIFYSPTTVPAFLKWVIYLNPISYMIAGFPMVIIGLIYLSRFIKTYPKPDKVLNHGS